MSPCRSSARPHPPEELNFITVKSQFNESRFNVKSQFKARNLVTRVEFHIKKSRFKESMCADGGHSLNRDYSVLLIPPEVLHPLKF